jgi:helicase
MVSLHYARRMTDPPSVPLFIDSGGFASLFDNASARDVKGLGVLDVTQGDQVESLHPADVLEFQEAHADVAFTLDFPVPPSLTATDAARRIELTIANAVWALENRRRSDLLLYASVQGHCVESYQACAAEYAHLPFDGAAIGGLVPRLRDLGEVIEIVRAVRTTLPTLPIHVFGVGKPEIVDLLFRNGVQSVDSSSYVKLAADGRLWGRADYRLLDASPTERLQLALCNLAAAAQRTLPLSASHVLFGPHLRERLST